MQNDVLWNPRRQRGARANKRSAVRQVLRDWRKDLQMVLGRRKRRVFRVNM